MYIRLSPLPVASDRALSQEQVERNRGFNFFRQLLVLLWLSFAFFRLCSRSILKSGSDECEHYAIVFAIDEYEFVGQSGSAKCDAGRADETSHKTGWEAVLRKGQEHFGHCSRVSMGHQRGRLIAFGYCRKTKSVWNFAFFGQKSDHTPFLGIRQKNFITLNKDEVRRIEDKVKDAQKKLRDDLKEELSKPLWKSDKYNGINSKVAKQISHEEVSVNRDLRRLLLNIRALLAGRPKWP